MGASPDGQVREDSDLALRSPKDSESGFTWFRLSRGEVVFSVGVDDTGHIQKAPPVAKWTIKKPILRVLEWYQEKGYRVDIA
jgi:hypothetical protein